MTMNKFFTGLIALVAGVALSAGSAFATKGYTIGDPAGMKLVPFYETGGSLFTADWCTEHVAARGFRDC